jgi:cytosine/adenosine deaminase-related metal-dependent hydrolase
MPNSIRNLSWAVVRDGSARRHVYRRTVDLHLKDGKITEITPAGARPTGPGEDVIDGAGLLALPGLINIHSHPSTEPGYRGVREDHGVPEQQMTGLMERLQAFRLPDDGRQGAATLAYAEMLRAGTTTATDVTSPFDGWLETMALSGMRFYAAPTFASARWGMSAPQTVTWKWDEARGLTEFEKAKRVMADAEAHNSRRLDAMVFPAQIDTVTPELFAAGRNHADESGRRFSTHIGQSVVEVREMIRRHNMTPVQWAAQNGLLKSDSVLAHCILLDDHPQIAWHTRKDLDLIAEAGASVAHCPQPFARYGLAMDHIGRYRTRGVNVGLGTDCAPHNLVEEMRKAAILARVAGRDITTVSTADLFHAATVGGATALMRDDLGRLALGKKADLVLLDLECPQMQPARDPLRSFVYHAADRAVRDVFVDGKQVIADFRVTTLDQAGTGAKLRAAQERMEALAPQRDYRHRTAAEITPLSLPGGN